MYLSTYQRHVLGRVMATLAEPHEESEIRARVGSLMLDLLGAQHYASYVWDDELQRFDRGVRINMEPSNLARYESHFQYHDPITFRMQPHRRAVRVTDVMPQAALRRTEFFNDFLQRDGLPGLGAVQQHRMLHQRQHLPRAPTGHPSVKWGHGRVGY